MSNYTYDYFGRAIKEDYSDTAIVETQHNSQKIFCYFVRFGKVDAKTKKHEFSKRFKTIEEVKQFLIDNQFTKQVDKWLR